MRNAGKNHAFETYCKQYVCQIQHYHCDSGCFADIGWMADASQIGQTLSFCNVNVHHQNGLAKKAITGSSRTSKEKLTTYQG